MKKKLILTVITAYFATFTAFTSAAPESFRDIVQQVNPAVVYIEITKEAQPGGIPFFRQQPLPPRDVTGSGSGVIIDSQRGYVLTAAHVISDINEAVIHLPDGRKFEALELLYDSQTDVGVVRIEVPEDEPLPEAKFGSSEELEVGDWVLAMGSPLGRALANSVSAGIVSGKGRKSGILGQLGIEDFIQTDAVINKGNSGGPLVNTKGEIIGINSNIISATGLSTGLGFAVPSDLVKDVVQKLIEEGKVVRGYLGVSVTSLDSVPGDEQDKIPSDLLRRGGAYIVDVVRDGPSDEAGIKSGDIIVQVDDREITSSSELIRYISAKAPDEIVECQIWRDGSYITINVKLGVRPGTEGRGATAIVTSRDRATEGYKKLGVIVDDHTHTLPDAPPGTPEVEAVRIRHIAPNSLADQFGLEDGDVITEVDGETVRSAAEFNNAVGEGDIDAGILLNVIDQAGRTRKVFIKKF